MWPLEKGHMWRLSYQGFLRYHLTALSVIQFEGRSQAEDIREQPGASAGVRIGAVKACTSRCPLVAARTSRPYSIWLVP